jgi:hypothetical protein
MNTEGRRTALKRIALAIAALALVAGISACGANTNSQGYKDGYELGQEDGAGGFQKVSPPNPTSCQAIVNMGLAWPSGGVPGDSESDFIAGFMAGCKAAAG